MTGPLRLLLFGDGRWAADSLRRLLLGPHQIAAVVVRVTPSGGELGNAARAAGLPVLAPRRVNDAAVVAELRALAPDLGLSIAYDQIFESAVGEIPSHGLVNFHAGMLPFYRGRNVINWALINGEREIGVTAHFVDAGIDTGDVLLQRRLPVGWTETYGDVLCRVVQVIPDLVEEAVAQVANQSYTRRPQPEVGTYFAARGEGDEWLDWCQTSVELHNKVRAITRPGPGARTLLGSKTVTVWRAYCDPGWPKYRATPGQVVGRTTAGALVKTGDSVLLLTEVQLPGGASAPPSWPIGTRLGAALPVAAPRLCADQREEGS